jgi:deoxyribonuclease-4
MPKKEAAVAMQTARVRLDVNPVVIHANYLINLASCEEGTKANSIRAFRGELERAAIIGAEYVVLHPGSCKGQTVAEAIAAFAENMAVAAEGLEPPGVTILLENTAGAGNILGSKLEELAVMGEELRDRLEFPVGYCLDTCHLLASGYDVATAKGLEQALAVAEATIGLNHVPVIHSNDSKTPLNSHRDRHEHIGKGFVGIEAFGRIVNHPKLRDKAFILETPEDEDGDHGTNIAALQALINN